MKVHGTADDGAASGSVPGGAAAGGAVPGGSVPGGAEPGGSAADDTTAGGSLAGGPGDAATTTTSPAEITVKAVVLGVVLAAVLAGANAYLGLKVGLTVSASIPAAVISMAVFRLLRGSTIVENNIVQTAASAGESLAAGVIFTLPALVLLGYWQDFPFLPVAAISLCGGVLGVLFTVPLRRALIVERPMTFPEGVATAEVLRAGKRGGRDARYVLLAGVAAAVLKLCQTGFGLAVDSVHGAVNAGRAVFGISGGLGAALLGVGYIVRINVAALVMIGGAVAWFVGIPIYMATADPGGLAVMLDGATGYDAAEAVWSARIRYLGVGAMGIGGVWALASVLGPVRASVRASLTALRESKRGGGATVRRADRDLPGNWLLWGTLLMALPVLAVFLVVVDPARLQIGGGVLAGTIAFGVVFALVAGFLFSAVSGYMTGLVGASNNPVSGVTILTLLTGSVCLLLILGIDIDFGADRTKAVVAAATSVLIAAVVSCAAAIAGDNLHDLKTGYLVGSTPLKQQIMLIVGVVVSALCIAPILSLLYTAYGLGDSLPRPGMDSSQALQAPQATLMSSVAKGVFSGGLPWGVIGIGAVLAVGIIVVDQVLRVRGASFRMPVLAVAIGLYLPLDLSVPIFIGGLVSVLVARATRSRSADDREAADRRGLLFASGLISGEALVGIALAVPFAIAQSADVLMIEPSSLGLSAGTWTAITDVLSVLAFLGLAVWLYRTASRRRAEDL